MIKTIEIEEHLNKNTNIGFSLLDENNKIFELKNIDTNNCNIIIPKNINDIINEEIQGITYEKYVVRDEEQNKYYYFLSVIINSKYKITLYNEKRQYKFNYFEMNMIECD